MENKQVRWRLRCWGQVQRVGFRYTALYLARRLKLIGWVRNLTDGSVQMEAQGDVAQVRQFLIRLKAQPHIHIEKTVIEELPLQQREKQFRVLS